MPKYKCLNKECILFNEIKIRNTKIRIVENKVIDSGKECPECKQECESLKEDGFTTAMHGGENVCNR